MRRRLLLRQPGATGSVGTYCIPAGGLDTPSTHEDEIYVVTAGRAKIATPGSRQAEVGQLATSAPSALLVRPRPEPGYNY